MFNEAQMRAARALLGLSQGDLAARTALSLPTIKRMETLGIDRSTAANVEAVKRAFEAAGVEFLAADASGGVGVRLRRDAFEG
ncbi:helix-turn-helix domain-containing protein [Pannonibacter tanglangensis]|uniref:Helix-turn-helix domain-containing protein n=1 Tax=Pannonibacter tanglangensis TaxID=2750084 RepID=A0ABW9ZNI1_9HYPH|nr:helix-turn-helix domain-containing protein [Pannonibacter sp. XCT-34]NBN65934.1 helix-turn-helix domain-containing protein [Pannonibacter sp. XCT-34]